MKWEEWLFLSIVAYLAAGAVVASRYGFQFELGKPDYRARFWDWVFGWPVLCFIHWTK
jgi:hypothetical protein